MEYAAVQQYDHLGGVLQGFALCVHAFSLSELSIIAIEKKKYILRGHQFTEWVCRRHCQENIFGVSLLTKSNTVQKLNMSGDDIDMDESMDEEGQKFLQCTSFSPERFCFFFYFLNAKQCLQPGDRSHSTLIFVGANNKDPVHDYVFKYGVPFFAEGFEAEEKSEGKEEGKGKEEPVAGLAEQAKAQLLEEGGLALDRIVKVCVW